MGPSSSDVLRSSSSAAAGRCLLLGGTCVRDRVVRTVSDMPVVMLRTRMLRTMMLRIMILMLMVAMLMVTMVTTVCGDDDGLVDRVQESVGYSRPTRARARRAASS